MDEFAQSREDDDLFADEFEPISDPVTVIEEAKSSVPPQTQERTFTNPAVGHNSASNINVRQDHGEQPEHNERRNHGERQEHSDRREQGERRGRGGRAGFRGKDYNGLGLSRYATSSDVPPAQPATDSTPASDIAPPQAPTAPLQHTTPAAEPSASARTPAVRGDRSATGGPAHKKLTEEELSAKMEKMKVINAEKAERHRLSEADQAAYQHREKELAKERREKAVAEKKNERVMEMERAKNRERKMNAQGGREWDSEKVESDIVDGQGRGRSSEYVRGGHGGVIRGRGGLADSRFSGPEEAEETEYQSRGRGGIQNRGRGPRGGRGGRGGKPATVPSAEDFPSLPTPAKAPVSAGIEVKAEALKSPTGEKGPHDWAEEMATPVEEKKMDI